MMSSSRDLTATSGAPRGTLPAIAPPPTVQCDACEAVMTVPPECVASGVILGLLICSQCVEDDLSARTFTYPLEQTL